MREGWRGIGAVAAGPAAAAALAGVIAACGSAQGPRGAPPVPGRQPAVTPRAVPYNLYTHCGIGYVRVGNRYYEATAPLSDGSGNPPPGWGNPDQPGTLTLVSPDKAIFTDKAGHRVVFTLVTSGPARNTARVCA